MRQACCWLAGGNGFPEAGGAGEAGMRDHGPHSPPSGYLRSRYREGGRRMLVVTVPPGGRGHRGRLRGASRLGEKKRSKHMVFVIRYSCE